METRRGVGGILGIRLGVKALIETQLSTDVQQHVVLVYANETREDPAVPINIGLLPVEGVLKEVENGYDPLDRLEGVTGAVNGDRRDCQSSASPWASSESPGPRRGMGLEVTTDPCWDRWGEENCVGELPWDIVKTTSNLRDGYVTHPCGILAVAMVGGGRSFPTGG